MWGGYVYVRDGVFYTLHFTWSTPQYLLNADASSQWHYALPIQRQSGVNEYLDLQVTTPDATTPALNIWCRLLRSYLQSSLRAGVIRDLRPLAPDTCSDLALATPPHLVASVY